jgi:hypothetical protein
MNALLNTTILQAEKAVYRVDAIRMALCLMPMASLIWNVIDWTVNATAKRDVVAVLVLSAKIFIGEIQLMENACLVNVIVTDLHHFNAIETTERVFVVLALEALCAINVHADIRAFGLNVSLVVNALISKFIYSL